MIEDSQVRNFSPTQRAYIYAQRCPVANAARWAPSNAVSAQPWAVTWSGAIPVAMSGWLIIPVATAIVPSASRWRAQWLEQRRAELLPVEYFHVVFTVPEPLVISTGSLRPS